MGQCVLREMGLENQEWSADRRAQLMLCLKQYKENEQKLNQILEDKIQAKISAKKLRQLQIEKEVRRQKRGGDLSSDEDMDIRQPLENKQEPEHEEQSSIIEEVDEHQNNNNYIMMDDLKSPTDSYSQQKKIHKKVFYIVYKNLPQHDGDHAEQNVTGVKKFVNTVFQPQSALDHSVHEQYSNIFSDDFEREINNDDN